MDNIKDSYIIIYNCMLFLLLGTVKLTQKTFIRDKLIVPKDIIGDSLTTFHKRIWYSENIWDMITFVPQKLLRIAKWELFVKSQPFFAISRFAERREYISPVCLAFIQCTKVFIVVAAPSLRFLGEIKLRREHNVNNAYTFFFLFLLNSFFILKYI